MGRPQQLSYRDSRLACRRCTGLLGRFQSVVERFRLVGDRQSPAVIVEVRASVGQASSDASIYYSSVSI